MRKTLSICNMKIGLWIPRLLPFSEKRYLTQLLKQSSRSLVNHIFKPLIDPTTHVDCSFNNIKLCCFDKGYISLIIRLIPNCITKPPRNNNVITAEPLPPIPRYVTHLGQSLTNKLYIRVQKSFGPAQKYPIIWYPTITEGFLLVHKLMKVPSCSHLKLEFHKHLIM